MEFWANSDLSYEAMCQSPAFAVDMETAHSRDFLQGLALQQREDGIALELAAGIGRISREILTDVVPRVDLQELVPQLAANARTALGPRLRRLHVCPLQIFLPPPLAYDIIWAQWALELLTDTEVVRLLRGLKAALRGPEGLLIVKESVDLTSEEDTAECLDGYGGEYHAEEHKYVRTLKHLRQLILASGLTIRKEDMFWWPDDLMDEDFESHPLLTLALS